jgi:hypothetical protein
MLSQPREDVLARAQRGDHIVHAYESEVRLADAVATFLDAGAREGQSGLIVATPGHRALFGEKLEGSAGAVRMLDAEEVLAKVTVDGRPRWQVFRGTLGPILDELARSGKPPRVYGEMVDVLWQRGKRDAALELEAFWNRISQEKPFALLCAYRIDVLDGAVYGGPLECVCEAHTHFFPPQDYSGLDEAVLEATERVLDPAAAQMLLAVSRREPLGTRMPHGQSMLLWLRRHMPRTSGSVLRELAARYRPQPPASRTRRL